MVGERGFEPPTSASRTLRANQAALLPVSPGIIGDSLGVSQPMILDRSRRFWAALYEFLLEFNKY